MVEGAQPLEHGHTNLVGADLVAGRAELLFDVGDHAIEHRVVEPARAGTLDPGAQLRAIERLRDAGTLADGQRDILDALVRRVPPTARQALPPSSDRGTLFRNARIDDLVVVLTAVGTPHPGNGSAHSTR